MRTGISVCLLVDVHALHKRKRVQVATPLLVVGCYGRNGQLRREKGTTSNAWESFKGLIKVCSKRCGRAVSADIDSEITHIRIKECSFAEDTERAPEAYHTLGPFEILGNVKRQHLWSDNYPAMLCAQVLGKN